MLRYLTAGESHGRALIAILEGIPAGLKLTAEDIDKDLARRKVGYGRGDRMKLRRTKLKFFPGFVMAGPLAVPSL